MRLNLQVNFEDETSKDVTCNAADFVAFEDKFNVSIASLGVETKLSYLLFLAWHSEKRTKGTDKPFDTWLERVVSVGDSTKDPK
jgi:hypothetical protein